MKNLSKILSVSIYLPLIFPIALYSFYLRIYFKLGQIPANKDSHEIFHNMYLHNLIVLNSLTFTFLIVIINFVSIIMYVVIKKNKSEKSILIGFIISTIFWVLVVVLDPFGIFTWVID